MAASDRVAIDSARNQHAMKVAGSYDDGDGYISDQEWTRYQQDLGNTWNAKTGWSNNGQPSHQAAASRAATHTSNKKLPDINTFDRTAYGSGSHKNTDKLSGHDLKRLESYGYGLQEIIDYAEKSYAEGSKGGRRAHNVLDEFKNKLISQRSQPAYTPAPAAPPPPPKETGPRIVTGDKNITIGDYGQGSGGELAKGGGNSLSGVSGDINIAGDSNNSLNNTGVINEGMGNQNGNSLSGVSGDINIDGDSNFSVNNTGIIDKGINIAGLGPVKDPDKFLDDELSSLSNPNEGVADGIDSASADMNDVAGMSKENRIDGTTGPISVAGNANNSVLNSGLMDFSVNISETGRGGGLSNFGGAMAGIAINNNLFNRDFNQFGYGQALNAINLADLGSSQERIANLEDATNLSKISALKKSDKNNQLLFGDPFYTTQLQPGQMYSFSTEDPDYSEAERIYNS